MLAFIPMNMTASVYSYSDTKDSWGQPTLDKTYTGRCYISYNTDLTAILEINGVTTTMSASVVFHGLVNVKNGDFVEFASALGVLDRYQVGDVFFFRDYGNKVIATRVIIGKGSRS